MTKNEFEVLTLIDRKKKKWIQKDISEELNLSIGTINGVIRSLKDNNFIDNNGDLTIVTDKGYEALEPYRVKKAVIMAAGLGSRMLPLTLYTPKPMVIVRGRPMIELMIESLLDKGIKDIYIVVGYLKGRMYELLEKYPFLEFIYNEDYMTTNNISSAYLTRDKLKNAYLLEADLYINNKDVIRKYEYEANCLGVYKDRTDDWCYKLDRNRIEGTYLGGEDCYEMCGITYWDSENGEKLDKILKENYNNPGIKEQFIDTVYLNDFNKEFNFTIRECKEGDVLEFDTVEDLKLYDELYDI